MSKTKLGTEITFKRLDQRGERGFPTDNRGFIYTHERTEKIIDFEGYAQERAAFYAVRADRDGWRADSRTLMGWEAAVPGHFPTAKAAAAALAERLAA